MANKKPSRRTRKEKKQANQRRKNKHQRNKPAVANNLQNEAPKTKTSSKINIKTEKESLIDQSEKWFWHDARHSLLATLFVVILLLLAWYLI